MKPTTGVWIVGVKGGVAGTLIAGALAVRRNLAEAWGMVTETPLCDHLPLPELSELVFGGHDVRHQPLSDCVASIDAETGTIRAELRGEIHEDLLAVEEECRPGLLFHSGPAIEAISDGDCITGTPRELVGRVQADIESFRGRHRLRRVIVVNLASTEPPLPPRPNYQSADGIEELVESHGDVEGLIASTIYAVAAARCGCPYLNFTPSGGALLPGLEQLFERHSLPFMGSDGKTGETLVKSALAPLFRQRNLRVLSWQGYNMLGDRDGEVLADDRNKLSKLISKDQLLHDYLGYPLHTHVAIDYVPSLNDWKTAWDFVHFQGFLGVKMSMQITWQGCDAVLAAPIVLDMVRFLALAHERGESGPQRQLACFFKRPCGVDVQDFPSQYRMLEDYIRQAR